MVLECLELIVTLRCNDLGTFEDFGKFLRILFQILPPLDEIHVLEQYLDFTAKNQILRIQSFLVEIQLFNIECGMVLSFMTLDDLQRVLDTPVNFLHRQPEGMNGAFHAL